MKKIAVFNGNSLFAHGILSYLNSHAQNNLEVCSLDANDPQEALRQLISFVPDIVIIETQNFLPDPVFSSNSIMELFPHLIVLEIHVNSPVVEVIRREQIKPASFEELISSIAINPNSHAAAISTQQV